ncbi:hypothetical protein ACRAWG_15625 [Methylobacterium sp. P31]
MASVLSTGSAEAADGTAPPRKRPIGDDVTPGPVPTPGERPLGPDEPSAPVDVPPDWERPGIGPDVSPGDPTGPDLPADAEDGGTRCTRWS